MPIATLFTFYALRFTSPISATNSRYRYDFRDLRHLLAQVPLDAMLQRHVAARTPMTRPVKADLYNSVRSHIDKLNIPAIGLYGWTDQIDHVLHALSH